VTVRGGRTRKSLRICDQGSRPELGGVIEVRDFVINIADAQIEDLRERLARARLPESRESHKCAGVFGQVIRPPVGLGCQVHRAGLALSRGAVAPGPFRVGRWVRPSGFGG
jgi:hypothetical protein